MPLKFNALSLRKKQHPKKVARTLKKIRALEQILNISIINHHWPFKSIALFMSAYVLRRFLLKFVCFL